MCRACTDMHRVPEVKIRLVYRTMVSKPKDHICDKFLIAVECGSRTVCMRLAGVDGALSSLNLELKLLKAHAMPLPGSTSTRAFGCSS